MKGEKIATMNVPARYRDMVKEQAKKESTLVHRVSMREMLCTMILAYVEVKNE